MYDAAAMMLWCNAIIPIGNANFMQILCKPKITLMRISPHFPKNEKEWKQKDVISTESFVVLSNNSRILLNNFQIMNN